MMLIMDDHNLTESYFFAVTEKYIGGRLYITLEP